MGQIDIDVSKLPLLCPPQQTKTAKNVWPDEEIRNISKILV